jgi:CRISPR-associated protein (TIGR03984 family)
MINGLYRDAPIDETFERDVRKWFAAYLRPDMPWFLAHADDGVIWGRREENGTLKLSSDVFRDHERYPAVAVPLRAKTLQQARVFGAAGELLVWKEEEGFSARLIQESGQVREEDIYDEFHLVWGRGKSDVVEVRDRFTLLREGSQGICHAPPMPMPSKGRLALVVRHYLDFDEEGQAYVALSRLKDLRVKEKDE